MSIGRADYADRRTAYIDRLEEKADRAEQESAARFGRAEAILEAIPAGQPILAGHHSEARHRRDLAAADANMRKASEASEKADCYRNRAEAAEKSGAIRSDDPEALKKLEKRIAELEAEQERMKAVNSYYRKNGTARGCPGVPDGIAAELDREADGLYGRRTVPYPPFTLSNNSAEIRRLKDRAERLRAVDAMEHEEIPFDGGVVATDEAVNRVQIRFDAIPDGATREKLKRNGFRWSPREKAWQLPRTPRNLRIAKQVMGLD